MSNLTVYPYTATDMLHTPILIAGPTASGKSSLAQRIASATDGIIVNADALQVYDCWEVLTARPSEDECKQNQHVLYGHVSKDTKYSVGSWLRDLTKFTDRQSFQRQVILVGGTGLYLSSATNGLADIPKTPPEIRSRGDKHRLSKGVEFFQKALKQLDPVILETIDQNNAVRLQRAWEVAESTGKPLSAWQREPTVPLIPKGKSICINLAIDANLLLQKIDKRFDWMLENGVLDECQTALRSDWDPNLPSSRALGATELIAYLRNEMSLEEATAKAKVSTHQYAKRQRTWFRSRMSDWHQLKPDTPVSRILDLSPV